MKNTFTTFLVMLLPFFAFPQKNFHRYSLGFGGGISKNGGDLPSPGSRSLITGNADYFISPYVQTGLEFQSGKMLGESSTFSYANNFKSLLFVTRIHAGQFMRVRRSLSANHALLLDVLKGLYAGTGAGVMFSKQSASGFLNDKTVRISASNTDAIIPLTLGLDNSGFQSRFLTGIAYQGHFALSDQIDGYESAGSRKDYYSSFIISVKYKLGPRGIY